MKIHDVEQGSPSWFQIRAGKPTASAFSKLVTNTLGEDGKYAPSKAIESYAAALAAEVFAGKPMDEFHGNSFMDRGKEHEAEAIALYGFTRDCEVQKVGFITDDAETCGCSPDGLVGEDGGLEVKILKAENHVKVASYYEKYGRAEPKYTQQVQGGLWITGRKWWDQLFWSPELPAIIIRQTPDLVMCTALDAGVREVCKLRDSMVGDLRKQSMFIPKDAAQ